MAARPMVSSESWSVGGATFFDCFWMLPFKKAKSGPGEALPVTSLGDRPESPANPGQVSATGGMSWVEAVV